MTVADYQPPFVYFGGKDHATVINAVDRIRTALYREAGFANELVAIRFQLKQAQERREAWANDYVSVA